MTRRDARDLLLLLVLVAVAPLVGCHRVTTVRVEDAPRLVVAQALDGDVEVTAVGGERATIDAPLRSFAIVPAGTLVFMAAPDGATPAEPVAPSEVERRLARGWTVVDLTIEAPFLATADRHTLDVAELQRPRCTRRRASACGGFREGRDARIVRLPAAYVHGLAVEDREDAATAAAALGIGIAGAAAVAATVVGVMFAVGPRRL